MRRPTFKTGTPQMSAKSSALQTKIPKFKISVPKIGIKKPQEIPGGRIKDSSSFA